MECGCGGRVDFGVDFDVEEVGFRVLSFYFIRLLGFVLESYLSFVLFFCLWRGFRRFIFLIWMILW